MPPTLAASTAGIERVVIGTGTAAAAVTTATTAINVNASATGNALTIVGNDGANTLTGTSFNNLLLGNGGADNLRGGLGNHRIFGGLGNDVLTGGAGLDSFIFSTALSATSNRDTITGFSVADETIEIENAVFTALGGTTGVLSARAFVVGAAAADATDRIIYNSSTGALLYDSEGTGRGAAVQFATLSSGLRLTNSDFLII